MKKLLSALISIIMLFSLSVSSFAEKQIFSDVKASDWFYGVVTEAAELGVMKGVGNGKFEPKKSITRAEMVTALARIASVDVTGMRSNLGFSDTPKEQWYADYVGWAVANGLVNGYNDNTFRPDVPILRQELAKLFVCFIDYMEITIPSNPKCDGFNDKLPGWAAEYIERLRLSGLVEGSGGNFNPANKTTRAEFAAIVTRFYPYTRDEMFTKFVNITDYFTTSAKAICLDAGTGEWMTTDNMSEAILTPMGLSSSTYKVVFNDSEFKDFVSSYPNIQIGDSTTVAFKIYIMNTETGEKTDTKNIRFHLTKTDIEIYVDPDSFDSGIEESKYSEMLDKSLTSLGNLSRLAKVFEKAERGEDITVAYIGGSVTAGSGAGIYSCYARISANWFRARYPDITVNYINAGIGGTPSVMGNIRVYNDVLKYNPDLVYVEFSINDELSGLYTESYESLVRTILKYKSSPAVILLFTPDEAGKGAQENDMPIGYFYDLPMVSVSDGIHYGIDNGYFDWSTYGADSVHPSPWGHQVYSDMIENLLREAQEKIKTMSPDELTVNPIREDTVTGARFDSLVYTDSENADTLSLGSWQVGSSGNYNSGWTYSADGTNDPLTIKFTGENLLLLYQNSADNANIIISVDGNDIFTASGDGNGCSGEYAGSFADGEHILTVRVANGETLKKATVFAFGIN